MLLLILLETGDLAMLLSSETILVSIMDSVVHIC